MKVSYEKMTKAHTEEALKLFKKLEEEASEVSFAEIKDEDIINEWLDNPLYYLYVAKDEDKVVAIFRCIRGSGNKNHSGFLTIAITPEYRGNRIGGGFTRYCLAELKKEGLQLVRVYIYSDNIPSITTAIKCGFVISGTVYKHHYKEEKGYYVDDIILHKEL